MKLLILFIAMFTLSMPALATPSACPPGHDKIGSCEDGGNGDNGNGNGNGYGTVYNTNTNTLTNQQIQGQAQQQGQQQTATATGGNATASVVGEGGSLNLSSGSSSANNSFSVGDTTLNNQSTSSASISEGAVQNTITATGSNTFSVAEGANQNSLNVSEGALSQTQTAVGGSVGDITTTGGSVNVDEGAVQNAVTVSGISGGTGGSVNIEEGAVNNSSSATGGSIAEGAVTVNNNFGGEDGGALATQTVEGSTQVVEGSTTEVTVDASSTYEAAEIPVNAAPPSFSAICSSGAAGSGKSFSLSLAVTNDVCQALMIADAYMAIGDQEEAMKWVEAAARHAKWKGGLGYFRHVITLGIL